MEYLRTRHATLLAAVLVAALLVFACAGIVPVLPAASIGPMPMSPHIGIHAMGQPALALSGKTGSGGLSAGLALVGFALAGLCGVRRIQRATPSAPLGWHKLAAGLVPLPLRI